MRQVKCDLISAAKKAYYRKYVDGCRNNSSKLYKELNKLIGKNVHNSVITEYISQKKLAMEFRDLLMSKIKDGISERFPSFLIFH